MCNKCRPEILKYQRHGAFDILDDITGVQAGPTNRLVGISLREGKKL
jgi:hypothetical protein